jgi:hypothetical protein
LLFEEYRWTVESIDGKDFEKRFSPDPELHLVKHLMTFYGRGILNIDEPDGLLTIFFNTAPKELREYALEFIGRSLHEQDNQSPTAVPDQVLERFQALWVKRFNTTQDSLNAVSELAAFGWWFTSKKFDDKWAMSQLLEVLRLGVRIDLDYLVVERLAELAPEMLLNTIECLAFIIKSDKDGLEIEGWKEYIYPVLAIGLQSGEKAQQATKELINLLVNKGKLEFRTLLSKNF